MKVLALNGSPRKERNTAILLNHALEGSASQGADTELIHLYDFNYRGCVSCFACKIKDGKSYGKCIVKDDLTSILEKIEEADAIVFGSPVYVGAATSAMRSLLERLIFPYLVYDKNYPTLFKKKISTGFIYTMNTNDKMMKEMKYDYHFRNTEIALERTFGAAETLFVTDTSQFNDYSKYVVTVFDSEEKAKRWKEEFPKSCKKAFDMGMRFAVNT